MQKLLHNLFHAPFGGNFLSCFCISLMLCEFPHHCRVNLDPSLSGHVGVFLVWTPDKPEAGERGYT